MLDYAPDKQIMICSDKDKCYLGTYPTLAELKKDFGRLAPITWLIPQLTNLAEFCNSTTTLGERQIRNCAEMIASTYYFLKISELMLFFYRFKSGNYGQIYGAMSPMNIMIAIKKYLEERNNDLFSIESSKYRKKMEEDNKNAISAEEYFKPQVEAIINYMKSILAIINMFKSAKNYDKH